MEPERLPHGYRYHTLKTDSDSFQAVKRGDKTYEIRFDDREFQVGDILRLKETKYTGEEMKNGKPLEYTGQELILWVTHILKDQYGLKDGWVIMSITK